MNEKHRIAKKKNRLNRLIRRLKEVPADSRKKDRRDELNYELSQLGIHTDLG